jgi:hypothetical protein
MSAARIAEHLRHVADSLEAHRRPVDAIAIIARSDGTRFVEARRGMTDSELLHLLANVMVVMP